MDYELRRFEKKSAPGRAEDLEAVLALADEVRRDPRHWRIIYACHEQGFWRKFELPAPNSIRQLYVGGRFLLAPMFRALEFCTPFGVVIFDRGRARAFVVRGKEIQEFTGRMPMENLELHIRDSRIARAQHVDRHMEEHVEAYFKELAANVREFLAEEKLQQIVFGCREDVWGEAEQELAGFERAVLIGRFAPADYGMPAEDVREAAYPIFEENRRQSGAALLQKIRDDPAHGAVGVNPVMERLIEGRVQKLVLGKPVEGTVSACGNCERLQPHSDAPCMFCGNTALHDLAADEGLIRQAVITDAEILTFDENEIQDFRGAAAWLRY